MYAINFANKQGYVDYVIAHFHQIGLVYRPVRYMYVDLKYILHFYVQEKLTLHTEIIRHWSRRNFGHNAVFLSI
jgi:hypothetical protein